MALADVAGSFEFASPRPWTRSSGRATIAARLALIAQPKFDEVLLSNSLLESRDASGQPGVPARMRGAPAGMRLATTRSVPAVTGALVIGASSESSRP